jgi:hypothetical protein
MSKGKEKRKSKIKQVLEHVKEDDKDFRKQIKDDQKLVKALKK